MRRIIDFFNEILVVRHHVSKKFQTAIIIASIVFLSLIALIFTSSLVGEQSYEMSAETLVNNLRTDTQNYKNVNRSNIANFPGHEFKINGPYYGVDPETKRIIIDTLFMNFYVNLSEDQFQNFEPFINQVKRKDNVRFIGKLKNSKGDLNFIEIKSLQINEKQIF